MDAEPLVVIAGQTASGKTALAIKIAQKFGGEIISADSWAVYRGFDIGTAKPSKAEQDLARFHLIDVADPKIGYSAVEFKKHALTAVNDIRIRGKLPIICGGTGLYIDSLVYDYNFLPAGEAGQREKLNELTIQQLLEMAIQKGYDLDDIDVRNKRRLIRLIETKGMKPTKNQTTPDSCVYLCLKNDPDTLQANITRRASQMIADGLEQEVANLAENYGWEVEPMKGIGYAEWRQYMNGDATLQFVEEQIIKNTKSLAKRQMTWFKRNKDIQWTTTSEQAEQIIQEKLRRFGTMGV